MQQPCVTVLHGLGTFFAFRAMSTLCAYGQNQLVTSVGTLVKVGPVIRELLYVLLYVLLLSR